MFSGIPSHQDLRAVVRLRNQDGGPSEHFFVELDKCEEINCVPLKKFSHLRRDKAAECGEPDTGRAHLGSG